MKITTTRSLSLIIALLISAGATRAQMPTPSQAGLNAAMLKLFGNHNAFSSKAQVRMLDKADKETMSMNMNFALLDGKIRLEVDLTQIKSKDLAVEMVAQLKQIGMDKMVSIVRPDKKATLIIYPSLQAYAEVPMSKEDAADLQKDYKVEKTKLGKETIDGHACEKSRVTVSDGNGGHQEAMVWNATDFKDFPIQMRMNQTDASVVMQYKDIQMTRPEAKQFDVPAGFTKHESMEKLMQGAMMKRLGGK